MISVLIKSSLIVVVTFLAAHPLRRQSAAMRHMIFTTGLICALVIPVLAALIPEWHPQRISNFSYGVYAPLPATVIDSKSVSRTVATSPTFTPPSLDRSLFWIWVTGLLIAAGAFLTGIAKVEWLVRGSAPLTSVRFTEATAGVAAALSLRRPVRLLQNHRAVLGTWGVMRPQLLLPRDSSEWPEERLRIVLIHELAHIKRWDWFVQMLAESARAIYWFNPLFWLLCRRLRLESEHACDDVVLNLGTDGRQYASHLLDIARTLKKSEGAWSPILAMAQSPNLERRFLAMLNPSLNRSVITRKSLLAALIVAIGLTLPLAAMRLQAGFGNVSGTVYDPRGAVVPGVIISATNVQTKESQQTTADEAGRFTFPHLQAGEYQFEATVPSFIAYRNRIVLHANENLKQNVTLLLGNIIERITVTGRGQPRPATLLPPDTPRRIRVGGNVQAANLIYQVRPVYPPSAQNSGVEGTVVLEGIIGVDGSSQSLRVLGSIDPDLTAAAMEAVRQWRYRPTLLNGEPVEVLTTISVDFKLTQ
jgi:TonB family protein